MPASVHMGRDLSLVLLYQAERSNQREEGQTKKVEKEGGLRRPDRNEGGGFRARYEDERGTAFMRGFCRAFHLLDGYI